MGQNTVIGSDLMTYFRKDSCVYLTRTMFKYLNSVADSLRAQVETGDVNIYLLASLSALVRLIKVNLRCLAVCKLLLDDVVSEEDHAKCKALRDKFDQSFAKLLESAVEKKAQAEIQAAEAREKAKADQEKEKQEKDQKDEVEKSQEADNKDEEQKKQQPSSEEAKSPEE